MTNGMVPTDFILDILALNNPIVDVEGIVAFHLSQVHEILHSLVISEAHRTVVSSLDTGVDAWFVVGANIDEVKLVRH